MAGSNSPHFHIFDRTQGKLPRLPFARMKEAVLGKKYDLNLIFIGEKRSQDLNAKYRKKGKPANVLAFPLSEAEGEIFITPQQAKKDASHFKKSYNDFIGFLFIHGLLHLKGERHGEKMEAQEQKFVKKFSL